MKRISMTTLWVLANAAVWIGGSALLWISLLPEPAPAALDASPGLAPTDTTIRLAEASADALTRAPVFSRDRAAINPPGSAPATVPAPPEALPRLVGILRGADGAQRAVLEGSDGTTRRTLGEHADVGGWQVREIQAKAVILTRGAESVELRLGPTAPAERTH